MGINTAFIKEVQVKTGGFEPQYGQSQGGIVNIITKGGGKEFHGSLYGYARPQAFEATRTQPDDFPRTNKFGKLLRDVTRHFLLMTATPHNGKEEDFQLFMALLAADRFEGRFREGAHHVDTSDLMRRMVKETLLKFDGKPLFPERRAYTVDYELSDGERDLY